MATNADASTLSPLPEVLSHGLVAVSTFGLLSFFCSTSLFLYLSYRLISWRCNTHSKAPTNQFLFLIYNLLVADIQQSLAFLLNIHALRNNGIIVGTPTCFAQGWFISTGDLASSVFISAIAVHTFLAVVKDYRLPTQAFYAWIVCCWIFVYLLGILGPAMHGKDFYARAAAWCWINSAYDTERLWLHYFWIFVAMFSTILIYAFIFLFLMHISRSNSSSSSSASIISSSKRLPPSQLTIHGAKPLMILYPAIYTVCTIPLAAGRIATLAGRDISLGYFCVAGSMIACNGWLDVLLYSSTRADIVFSDDPPGEGIGLETFAFLGMGMGRGRNLGTVTTIEAQGGKGGEASGRVSRLTGRKSQASDSDEMLYGVGLGQIGIKEEVEVRVDVEDGKGWGFGGKEMGSPSTPDGVRSSESEGSLGRGSEDMR